MAHGRDRDRVDQLRWDVYPERGGFVREDENCVRTRFSRLGGRICLGLEGCQHSLKLFRCEPHVPSINVSCLVGSRGSQPANFRVGQWVRVVPTLALSVMAKFAAQG
ncbi:hypothetical protein Bbelb_173840 [Branchiostoma belcheri]|nr:hypothetical protein Bbelb_173840 [Branchiostoma belcheri]